MSVIEFISDSLEASSNASRFPAKEKSVPATGGEKKKAEREKETERDVRQKLFLLRGVGTS